MANAVDDAEVITVGHDGVTDPEKSRGRPVFNKRGLEALGVMLSRKFDSYENDRKLAELRWVQDARQRRGVYDPQILQAIPEGRSKAYPRLTRIKCVGMLSKLMNLLFPVNEKNWTIGASDIPNLHPDDMQLVLDNINEKFDGEGVTDAVIEEMIREFTKVRARNLERVISDQLQELGGSRSINYTMMARSVLKSGIDYGLGVLRGPFARTVESRTWTRDSNGLLVADTVNLVRPLFEFVPVWDYYPDMTAKTFESMEGQFQRSIMSKHQLIALRSREDFIEEAIVKVLQTMPSGNYKTRQFETDLRNMGLADNTEPQFRDKYEVLMWEGHLSGKVMHEAGVTVEENKRNRDVLVQVWMIGGIVIKAEMQPWSHLLEDGDEMTMYHQFTFEEDDTSLIGQSLPSIMRDSQMGLCEAARMALDNGAIQRNIEVNLALLDPTLNTPEIETDKVWVRNDDGPTANIPAVRVIDMPMNLAELQGLATMFKTFADEETFINQANGGDLQRGPSEPFRTAAGASMLRGEAALPLKDVVRNFDTFTESIIGSLVKFNNIFNEEDVTIRGDFTPIARGASSLVAKEVLGVQLDNLASTFTEQEQKYIDFRKLAQARVRVRDIDDQDIVVSKEAAERIDQRDSELQQLAQQQQQQQISAEIRKVISEAFKNVTQGTKNAANAKAQEVKVALDSLEQGLNTLNAGEDNGTTTTAEQGADGTAEPAPRQ